MSLLIVCDTGSICGICETSGVLETSILCHIWDGQTNLKQSRATCSIRHGGPEVCGFALKKQKFSHDGELYSNSVSMCVDYDSTYRAPAAVPLTPP